MKVADWLTIRIKETCSNCLVAHVCSEACQTLTDQQFNVHINRWGQPGNRWLGWTSKYLAKSVRAVMRGS